jgi:hypothetical protein
MIEKCESPICARVFVQRASIHQIFSAPLKTQCVQIYWSHFFELFWGKMRLSFRRRRPPPSARVSLCLLECRRRSHQVKSTEKIPRLDVFSPLCLIAAWMQVGDTHRIKELCRRAARPLPCSSTSITHTSSSYVRYTRCLARICPGVELIVRQSEWSTVR